MAPRRLAQHGRLAAQIAVVKIIVAQTCDHLVPLGGRVHPVEIEVGVRVRTHGHAVEAGLRHVRHAKGAGVAGNHIPDLEQVHQDDVGPRPCRRRRVQPRQQGAVEGGDSEVGQRRGGRAAKLRRNAQLGQVGDQHGSRPGLGDAVDDEVDVRRRAEGYGRYGAGRIGRGPGGRQPLEDVVRPAQDADQIIRPECPAALLILGQLQPHPQRLSLTVRARAAEGVVDAAGNRPHEVGGVEAQPLGEHRAVGESPGAIGRRGRGRSAGRQIQVAIVRQAVAEHDQTAVALGRGGSGGRHGGQAQGRQRGATKKTSHRNPSHRPSVCGR